MSKHTTPIVSITDELLAELEAAANAATPGPYRQCGADTESKSCACGQIWSTATDELVAFAHNGDAIIDSPAAGQSANSQFMAAANPATILALLALLAERAELKRDARRYQHMRASASSQWRNGPGLYWYLPRYIQGSLGEQLDQAIDAAMQETKP